MNIRKPTQSEYEQILNQSPQAIFDGTLREARPNREKIEKMVFAILSQGGYYLIAEENHCITGWILIGSNKDQFTEREYGFIYELFVAAEFRGNGISTQLMKAGIDCLKDEGYSEVRLSAFVENHAVKLYEKLGFKSRKVTMSLSLK
ncbi:GNAT family N-acetyltransferase [Cytobacillus purgationiresistens]|uniref:Ribosomal protein S18 acetylase RimI-like enzyme n=1 Tax=Cytobacillus purgationiresistens TaxID=863449 RepID=A0ABU0AKT6_9BACI|nr:GNAT family N-acetyltransferase [Cytobacillus purgationiresistens]MDQ0271650.1 ribosomal protein S18 acetylase RimI-like enzyme [Cytobacillus purgationiresistens]